MTTSVTIQDEQDNSVQNLTATKGGSDKRRRNFFAIAALLGGLVSFMVALMPPFNVNFADSIRIIAGISWLVLAVLFSFSSVQLKKLSIASFAIILSQYVFNDVLSLFAIQDSADFYTALNSTLLVLVLTIMASFIIFSTKTALKVSNINAVVSLSLIFAASLHLRSEIQLTILIEPAIYIAIFIFLVRALALFQNDADLATNQAEHYEKLAFYDSLTGIANRRKLVNEVQKEMATAQRYDLPLNIMIFDIDHFKKVNDTYGHNVGDQVLKSIGSNIKPQVRTSDCIGRWGGEEFLCVMPNTSAPDAFELAERLRMGIENLTIENGPKVTASFGIAQLIHSDDFDSFVNRADNALYEAKESGRNCCRSILVNDTDSLENSPVEAFSGNQV